MPAPTVRPETEIDGSSGEPGDRGGDSAAGSPAARCRHCDRPFRSESAWALHLGEVHPDALSPDERKAYEAADADERDELFVYHMKVVVALGLLYAGFVLVYMVLVQTF